MELSRQQIVETLVFDGFTESEKDKETREHRQRPLTQWLESEGRDPRECQGEQSVVGGGGEV